MASNIHIGRILIVFSLLFITKISYPQKSNIKFEHISIKEGLSASKVICILRDSRGFMWFGTQNGLNRYDGKSFKVYKHSPDDPNSLSNNQVQAIYEDKSENLWIGTYGGGLNKFEIKTEKFTHYRHDPENNNTISSDFVLSIYEDKSGFLWIGTNGSGINKFNMKEESFIQYSNNPDDPNSLSHNVVRSFYEDKDDILWIGTDGGGLNKFDKNTGKFTCYKHDQKNPNSLSHDFVLSIIEDEDGALWLATYGGGLNKFNKDTETFSHFKHDPNDLNSLANDVIQSLYKSATEPGVIWIATGDGIDKFEIRKEKFTHFKHDIYNSASLISNLTSTIYEDESGLVWVGTGGKGLSKYNKSHKKILHYRKDPTDANSLSSNKILTIYEDKSGILWIGTEGEGLNKFDRDKGIFTHYTHQVNNLNSLSNNKLYSLIEEKPGILWIGTFDGLNRFDTKNNKFTIYKHDPTNSKSLSHNSINALHIDRKHNLWIGTMQGGLNKLILNENENMSPVFLHYQHDPNDPYSISDNSVLTICEDIDGFLWFGTMSSGLNKLDKKEEKFYRYKHDPNKPNSLSNNNVSSIYQAKNGVLWIGTSGGGLNKLVPGDSEEFPPTFIHYREKDGLSNNNISGILEDNYHNLWISTKNGLSRFNPKEIDDKGVALPSAFKNYYVFDGLQGNEFSSASYFKNGRGEMFIGGFNGFNAFYPDSLKENRSIPIVVLTDFKLFGKDYDLDSSITEMNKIALHHNENFISFEFAVLDYFAPEKNKYAYKMEGVDPDWVYTDASRRFATYTQLDPGEYIFRVKGSNNDGVWNEEGTSITVIITPPWWFTWWAYLIYGLCAFSLLYGFRRYELNRLNWKNQFKLDEVKLIERAETDRLKSRFFANISHEFRTPLTLILGPIEKILSKSDDDATQKQASLVKRNANRLLGLINQLLDLSKLEAGKLELITSKANIVSFVKGITMLFESVAERKDITLIVKSTNDDIELYFDKEKMTKILTNLLSNAFKFTPEGGTVKISMDKADINSVEIKIRDTGVGIADEEIPKLFDRFYQVDSSQTREHEGTGIGLALTKELVELHHGTISADSKLGDPDEVGTGWTEFAIELPLGRKHLKDVEIVETEESVKEDIIVDKEEFGPTTVEEVDETEIAGEDKNILLVVEDNADVREFIKDSLGDDFQIEEASNGEQGVRKAEEIIPDLILSDIMMPKMDGNELTRILKNDEKTSHIPIILLTAKSEQESKLEGLESGADAYLIKPFDTKELHIRINNLINIRRKLQEVYSKGKYMQEPRVNKLSSLDERFMIKVMKIIEQHISEEEFSIEEFVKELEMGNMQMHRKLKALTGKSASRYIRSVRLARAKKMIEQKMGNISEIAYSVGFGSPAYFTRCFREEYGHPPSDLVN